MKRCYECGVEMGLSEIIKGQIALDIANEEGLEGWVHCSGDDDLFIDGRMANEIEQMTDHVFDGDLEGAIVICEDCVNQAAEIEGLR